MVVFNEWGYEFLSHAQYSPDLAPKLEEIACEKRLMFVLSVSSSEGNYTEK